eukprot:CAMPEP_0168536416 /NCGR_PEP_ID=MMETSP0405-20121227/19537_1 /TAXON_ID=498012 /ORGANISM="Trichosphaerium sp, Strain Am-I-7 wt" /LENGTH=117 /DNA_ID=CAMNT_0008564419 /DNA_START=153 /DNA_END=506 /DNA_ORIENTATION=-
MDATQSLHVVNALLMIVVIMVIVYLNHSELNANVIQDSLVKIVTLLLHQKHLAKMFLHKSGIVTKITWYGVSEVNQQLLLTVLMVAQPLMTQLDYLNLIQLVFAQLTTATWRLPLEW